MDIVLYMNHGDFLHKTGQAEDGIGIVAFWSMKRVPKNFSEGERIWIAVEGRVRGCVTCAEFNPTDLGGETIVWDSDTWMLLEHKEQVILSCKPFRGFRYRWWDKAVGEEGNDERP